MVGKLRASDILVTNTQDGRGTLEHLEYIFECAAQHIYDNKKVYAETVNEKGTNANLFLNLDFESGFVTVKFESSSLVTKIKNGKLEK